MAWRLNTALTNFRAAVDRAYPGRDRGTDGTIADGQHDATSDHQEDPDGTVDAWDMDVELNGPGRPYAADVEALKAVFERHPAARYWIHNRQIAHRNNGWRREPYTGPNPHDKHVHWNSNEATEDSTAPWILGDDMTPQELINTKLGSPALGDRTVGDWWKQAEAARREVVALKGMVADLANVVGALVADVAELKARPASGTGVVDQAALEAALRKVLGSVDGAVPPAA